MALASEIEPQATYRLFLVDDHELIRRGLCALVEDEPGFRVVGEAGSAREALTRIPEAMPDVVVLDVRLPDADGVDLCREIRTRFPDVKVLMLTSFGDQEAILESIVAGASGFVLKSTDHNEVVEAVRRIMDGQSLVDSAATASLFGHLRRAREPDPLEALSSQERRILELVAEGCTNREIAGQVHLAEQTVKNYVSNILAKLGLRHRTEAALFVAGLDRERDDAAGT
ncbi:MAG TPA: response regulator transcription factor [Actinomycetota bacterium]